MNRQALLQVCLLAPAFALGTLLFGWWAVPLLSFVWGFITRMESWPAEVAAVAACLGWVLLLIWTVTDGPVLELVHRTMGTVGLPAPVLVIATFLLPTASAWGAAVVGEATRSWFTRGRKRA